MAKQINPIETAITEYLKAQGVTFMAVGGVASNRDGWECDAWLCKFQRQGKEMFSDFYTGTGHRQLTKAGEFELRRAGKSSARYLESIKARHSVAVAPHVASVLHSLLLDSSSAEQNFHDWCDDFGYDKDSIKAQGIYNACCETLTKMRSFFTGTERQAMQEILQDY
jgi:hypothetical protein